METARIELSQWPTPYSLALMMGKLLVGLVDRPDYNWRLLDPGCGDARLARAVCEACAQMGRPQPLEIVGYELDTSLVQRAERVCDRVICDDFLSANVAGGPMFDACIINPPFEEGLDGAFLLQALAVSKMVVALVKADALFGSTRFKTLWEQAQEALQVQVALANRPWFGGLHTASSNYVVLVLSAYHDYRQFEPFQWWYDETWSSKKVAQVEPSWMREAA